MRVIGRSEVEAIVTPARALTAVRAAFAAFHAGQAVLASPLELAMPEAAGELHVKGGYLRGSRYFSVKAATGFYRNAVRGLPTSDGMTIVFDAETGEPVLVVADGGLLTELRTAAAGALAADLLAKADITSVTVVGAGIQARRQLTALLEVRKPARVTVWARRFEQATDYASWAATAHGLDVGIATDLEPAVRGSDLLVTTTPSTEPLISDTWLRPGVHVTAVGSDMPEKQELAPDVLARADKVVCDSVSACLHSGELHHAVGAGTMSGNDIWAELGAVVRGTSAGRERSDEITVADLTGLGIQDAAMANLVADAAFRRPATEGVPIP